MFESSGDIRTEVGPTAYGELFDDDDDDHLLLLLLLLRPNANYTPLVVPITFVVESLNNGLLEITLSSFASLTRLSSRTYA